MFILRHRDTILNNSITYFHFLFGRCVWCVCGCQRATFKGEGSPPVGSGDSAWAVGHAQQALFSAELSCWPPTLVFKSSSVLWYFFGCWSQETDLCFFLLFSFSHLVSVHLNPLSAVSFPSGSCSAHLAHDFCSSLYRNCVFLVVFLKQ